MPPVWFRFSQIHSFICVRLCPKRWDADRKIGHVRKDGEQLETREDECSKRMISCNCDSFVGQQWLWPTWSLKMCSSKTPSMEIYIYIRLVSAETATNGNCSSGRFPSKHTILYERQRDCWVIVIVKGLQMKSRRILIRQCLLLTRTIKSFCPWAKNWAAKTARFPHSRSAAMNARIGKGILICESSLRRITRSQRMKAKRKQRTKTTSETQSIVHLPEYHWKTRWDRPIDMRRQAWKSIDVWLRPWSCGPTVFLSYSWLECATLFSSTLLYRWRNWMMGQTVRMPVDEYCVASCES
jgi:hypothetical protein